VNLQVKEEIVSLSLSSTRSKFSSNSELHDDKENKKQEYFSENVIKNDD
jgi:hypothetical protein